ncbi:unnamed protein product [Sphagnum balticum]
MRRTEKDTKSVAVYSFARIFFEVLTGKVPFKDIPLRNILQSICDRAIIFKHPYGLEHVPHDNPQYLSFLVQLILSGSLEDVGSHNDRDFM